MFGMSEQKLILTTIMYLLAYAIDPVIIFIAYTEFLEPKVKKRFYNFLLCFGIPYILIGIKQVMILFGNDNSGYIFAPLILIYFLILAFLAFEAPAKRKIVIVILFYTLSFIVEAFYSFILVLLDIDFKRIVDFGLNGGGVTLLMRTTDLVVFLSFKNFFALLKRKDAKPYMILVYLILFIISGVVMSYYEGLADRRIMFYLYCLQAIVISIALTYIIMMLKNVIDREYEAVKRAELSESKIAFLNYSRETNEEIKSIRHDMKRHYNYLLELNRRKDYQAIESYLTELCNDLHATDTLYVCDNLILAVALSDAQKKAKEKNIDFTKIVTVNDFPFSDTEFNSVITNILDNAFEAVTRVLEGSRAIKFEIRKINELEIMIYCENTYEPEEYEEKAFLTTVKRDKDNHGYGTRIVRKIVKRHKGTVVYWKDKRKFYVKIIVRGKEQDENIDM